MPKTPHGKQQNHKRKRAREKHLSDVLRDQSFKCWWCGKPIARLIDLDPSLSIRKSKTGKAYHWTEGGEDRSVLIATLDHLIPLKDGGTNHRENLVAACVRCNNKRSNVSNKHLRLSGLDSPDPYLKLMDENIPALITPSILVFAREEIGLSVADAAKDLRIEPEKLLEWESGQSNPTVGQLEKIAQLYKKTPVFFYFPSPPPKTKESDSLTREEKLDAVLDYIRSQLLKCDRAWDLEKKQQHLQNARRAVSYGSDAYEQIEQLKLTGDEDRYPTG